MIGQFCCVKFQSLFFNFSSFHEIFDDEFLFQVKGQGVDEDSCTSTRAVSFSQLGSLQCGTAKRATVPGHRALHSGKDLLRINQIKILIFQGILYTVGFH